MKITPLLIALLACYRQHQQTTNLQTFFPLIVFKQNDLAVHSTYFERLHLETRSNFSHFRKFEQNVKTCFQENLGKLNKLVVYIYFHQQPIV